MLMPEWLKNLIDRSTKFFAKEPPLPPRHVSWAEAFELDSALDKDKVRKDKYVALLNQWENTKAGQEELTAYVDAKSRIPEGHVWKNPYREHNLNSANPMAVAYQIESDTIEKRHTDPKRVFLYFVPEDRQKWSAFDKFGSNGYAPDTHRMQINLEILSWQTQFTAKMIEGKKAEVQSHPLQPIQHEIRHAIDGLNKKFAKNVKDIQVPTTEECSETRGVEAENRLLQELDQPLRYAYNDPIFALQRSYSRGQTLSAEDYNNLRKKLYNRLTIDTVKCDLEPFSGSFGGAKLSENGAIIKVYQAVDAILKDYGIAVAPSGTSAPTLPRKKAARTPD